MLTTYKRLCDNLTIDKLTLMVKGSFIINESASYHPKRVVQHVDDGLKSIIDSNDYVRNCVSNKKKDYNSLSYLIDNNLSQSDCIKLGIGVEKVLRDIIVGKNDGLSNIKTKNEKGKKERDHLFKDDITKTIYYAELKSNLNLDTEKCKSTSGKCFDIQRELLIEYPDYKINMYLVGLRYYDKSLIPKVILQKYLSIKNNVLGVNNYLKMLNVDVNFKDENAYKDFLNYLTDKTFN